MIYNRAAAVAYARRWAFGRNPDFYIFDELGGDCTNFASQCIYAGAGVMNFTPDLGWYYISVNDRSAAWTGVNYLMKFLLTNTESGPYGIERPVFMAKPGDIIFLDFDGNGFVHTTVVLANFFGDIRLAAHSYDVYNRPLYTYDYKRAKLVQIVGVNP